MNFLFVFLFFPCSQLCSASELSERAGQGMTGEDPAEATKMRRDRSTSLTGKGWQRKAEGTGLLSLVNRRLREDLTNAYKYFKARCQEDGDRHFPVTGQGAVGTNWSAGSSTWVWGKKLLWGDRAPGGGCSERFCNLLPWAYSKLLWVNLLWQGAWTGGSPEVTSSPNHSMIVWFGEIKRGPSQGWGFLDMSHSKAQTFEFQ